MKAPNSIAGGHSLSQWLRTCTHTHTKPHPLALGPYKDISSPDMHSFLGYGKPEYLEKTYKDMGKTCKLHIYSGPGQESIFFSSVL